MKTSQLEILLELAASAGIQTSYESSLGGTRDASAESMIAVLQVMGLPLKSNLSNLNRIFAEFQEGSLEKFCEPVCVVWGRRRPCLDLTLPSGISAAQARVEIRPECGDPVEFRIALETVKRERSGATPQGKILRQIVFPEPLKPGYYDISIHVGKKSAVTLLIAAPAHAYRDPRFGEGSRHLGLFSPVYSLHSERSAGIGDLSDLGRFLSWAGRRKCTFAGTLPLFASFLDKPVHETSPYAPVSRLFWNEIFVDPSVAPEWQTSSRAAATARSASFRGEVRLLNQTGLVDYRKAYRLRRRLLSEMSRDFFESGRCHSEEFQEFLKREEFVEEYARFRSAGEKLSLLWPEWPRRMQSGDLRASDYDRADFEFHLYSQWLFSRQLIDIQHVDGRDTPLLYLDFPLGIHPGGFDTWAMSSSFARNVSAGCPPDRGHPEGQIWNIIPLHPVEMRKEKYWYLRMCFAKQMRFCSILRLDHIMSLFRLYWVPCGLGPADGVYVRYPCEEMAAILCLESHRNRCILVGEDLGTVPPEIVEIMKARKILRMYVQQRSLSADPEDAVKAPPENCFAYFGTHDQPTFRGFWNCHDQKDKASLGRLTPVELRKKISDRRNLLKASLLFLRKQKLLKIKAPLLNQIMPAFFRLLSRSPARAVMLNVEDFWLEEKPQNTPTTDTERPNWRRKHRLSIEEMEKNAGIKRLLKVLFKDRAV